MKKGKFTIYLKTFFFFDEEKIDGLIGILLELLIYCLKNWKMKFEVRLCWMGWYTTTIHGRDPTTARHGVFCLLRFRPGPNRPSLVNLVNWSSL